MTGSLLDMPGWTLPTLLPPEVAAHSSVKSCYVTIGTKVYDVSSFLPDHPGGADLILKYGGKDIGAILDDETSHKHSEAAYEVLDGCLVGLTPTEPAAQELKEPSSRSLDPLDIKSPSRTSQDGEKQKSLDALNHALSADDLSRETDTVQDYNTHGFLDLNKPLLRQVWQGGFSKDFYLQQVHRPRHYRGGKSAPLFGNFLEPLSKTAWWMVPTIWLPPVGYATYDAAVGLSNLPEALAYWLLGLFAWTLVEYTLHRCLFHVDRYLPDHRLSITAHFLLHGIHHYLPMDRYRLVMPPILFLLLSLPFYKLAHVVFFFNRFAAIEVFSGGVFGYICYDLTHYFLHHRNLPAYYKSLKKYHLQHHFGDSDNGFGVTSRFWDWVFGTELQDGMAGKKP